MIWTFDLEKNLGWMSFLMQPSFYLGLGQALSKVQQMLKHKEQFVKSFELEKKEIEISLLY